MNVPNLVVKILMLVATMLWLVGMCGCGIISYALSMDDVQQIGGSQYYLDANRNIVGQRDLQTQALTNAIMAGFCFPTGVYAVVMVVLVVLWFVTSTKT